MCLDGAIPAAFCDVDGISIDVTDTGIHCYEGCLTAAEIFISGAESECHNGHIMRAFYIVTGVVVGIAITVTIAFAYRHTVTLNISEFVKPLIVVIFAIIVTPQEK